MLMQLLVVSILGTFRFNFLPYLGEYLDCLFFVIKIACYFLFVQLSRFCRCLTCPDCVCFAGSHCMFSEFTEVQNCVFRCSGNSFLSVSISRLQYFRCSDIMLVSDFVSLV